MLFDKANNRASSLKPAQPNFSPLDPVDESETVGTGKRRSKVLPIGRNKPGFELIKPGEDAGNGQGAVTDVNTDRKNSEPQETRSNSSDVKARMEAVLARIKSRAAAAAAAASEALDKTDTTPLAAAEAEMPAPNGTTSSLQVKIITGALEKRLAEVFAMAREAEARAREADEKYRQAELQFNQEAALRVVAQKRVLEIEEEARQWMSTAEEEEARRREAETARFQAETARTEFEARMRAEAEARAQAEEARAQAEKALAEAQTRTQAAAFALEEAEQKKAEAEARAQAAEDTVRSLEAMMYEADNIARETEEKCRAFEARLHNESELRALAEQKLRALEEDLSRCLDLDLSQLQTSALASGLVQSPAETVPPPVISEELLKASERAEQLHAQFESEHKARETAERARAVAETRVLEIEAQLRKSEEKHRNAETAFKKVLRKQEAELRNLSQQVARANSPSMALAPVNESDVFSSIIPPKLPEMNERIKLVSYGVIIALLFMSLIWLSVLAYRQL